MSARGRPGWLPPEPAEAAEFEVEHHLAELAERLEAEGMDAHAARREAERRFGDPDGVRVHLERTGRRRRTMRRTRAGWEWAAGACRGAVRSALRRPGFALGVVLTLGLGVGANAAMFAVLDRLLFQPPTHVADPDRVVRVMVERTFLGQRSRQASITFPDYLDFKRAGAFAAVAAYSGGGEQTLGRGSEATRVRIIRASHDFFPLLGVAPALGRFYGPDEDRIGADATVVVSHEFWRATLASDPGVLGRTLVVGGHPHTVIGIAPAGFTGTDLEPVDLWLPLETSQGLVAGTEWRDSRGWYWMRAIARLADGATVEAAAAEATALHRAGRSEQIERGDYEKDVVVELDPMELAKGPEASPESKVARWLGGVSLVVLLIACANVANLLLANAARRRREMALRLALGVERARLVAQMVLESVLLALVGGAAALLVAVWGGAIIRSTLLPGIAFPDSGLSGRLVAFTAAAAVLAGVLAGLGPALQGTRADLAGDLAHGGRGSARRSRARALLTVAQAALSVVLLVGAGLFVRSVAHVRSLDLGFDVDRLVLASLEFDPSLIPGSSADGPPSPEATLVRNELYQTAVARLAAIPGVTSVAATDAPFQWALAIDLEVPGLDSVPTLPGGGPYLQDVTSDYFATVGLRITRGRGFATSDDAGAPAVTIVSETMARTLWPDSDPVGRTLLLDAAKTPFTVVGVAEDASRGDIVSDPYMSYYVPIAQRPTRRLAGIYARTEGDAAELATAAAPALRALDPRVRYATAKPLRDWVDPQARSWTLGATLFTVFGLLALVVAAIGLYSVLAFDVAQRTRELGIRSALGAEKRRLLRAVVGEGARLGGLGVALGLGISVVAAPFARDLLFEVSPRDPLVLGVVGAGLFAVALLASLVPGLRATRVDPMIALRSE